MFDRKYMLSIIIPTYNVEYNIEKLLNILSEQLCKKIQLCIVDDGSTDKTVSIIKKFFLQRVFNIKFKRTSHIGVSKARNLGIDMANGEYITFIDADDLISPDFVSTFMLNIRDSADVMIFNSNIKESRLISNKDICYLLIGHDKNHDFLVDTSIHSKFYRLDFVRKFSLIFDTSLRLGEDLIFNFNCILNSKNIYIYPDNIYCKMISHSMMRFTKYNLKNEIEFRKQMNNISHIKNIPNMKLVLKFYKITGALFLVDRYYSCLPRKSNISIWKSRSLLQNTLRNNGYIVAIKTSKFDDILGKRDMVTRMLLSKNMYLISLVFSRCIDIIKRESR